MVSNTFSWRNSGLTYGFLPPAPRLPAAVGDSPLLIVSLPLHFAQCKYNLIIHTAQPTPFAGDLQDTRSPLVDRLAITLRATHGSPASSLFQARLRNLNHAACCRAGSRRFAWCSSLGSPCRHRSWKPGHWCSRYLHHDASSNPRCALRTRRPPLSGLPLVMSKDSMHPVVSRRTAPETGSRCPDRPQTTSQCRRCLGW